MENVTHKLTVETRISKAVETESSRFAIGNVHVCPRSDGGAWLSATNSRVLAIVPDETAEVTAPVLMPGKIADGATRNRPLTVTANGRWENSKGKFQPLADEGRFPAVDSVVTTTLANDYTAGEYVAISLDASLLATLAEAITAVGETPIVDLFVKVNRERSGYSETAAFVRGNRGFGVIMPVCGDRAIRSAEAIDAQSAAFASDFAASRK